MKFLAKMEGPLLTKIFVSNLFQNCSVMTFEPVDCDFVLYFDVQSRLDAFWAISEDCEKRRLDGFGPQNRPQNRGLRVRNPGVYNLETNRKYENFGQNDGPLLTKIFAFPMCFKVNPWGLLKR